MNRIFIAQRMFQHQIDCFYREYAEVDTLTIQRGDIIEITNERKYVMDNGWYFLIKHNHQHDFYIALEDIEKYYLDQNLLSTIDIDLALNYFQYKIDEALDTGDEKIFLLFTKKLKEFNDLRVTLEQYVHGIPI